MSIPVNRHRLWQLVADAALIAAAWFFAFQLRFDFNVPPTFEDGLWTTIALVVAIKLAVFVALGFYNRWWRPCSPPWPSTSPIRSSAGCRGESS
jgi:FlaA1/EpsC-like NDP-sugar epimerase